MLQADGYAGYNALYATGRNFEAACWAHVRRKFFEIDQVQPYSFATDVLHAIAGLYAVEKLIKNKPPDQRVALRQAHSGPALEALKARLRETLSGVSKKLPLAKAINYALVRWDALVRYVGDGTIEIDNNPIERQIRPIALRRNYVKRPIMQSVQSKLACVPVLPWVLRLIAQAGLHIIKQVRCPFNSTTTTA